MLMVGLSANPEGDVFVVYHVTIVASGLVEEISTHGNKLRSMHCKLRKRASSAR